MVKHQVQGHYECAPTSIAMLLGLPKDDVVKILLPKHCKTWAEALAPSNAATFWENTRLLVRIAFGESAAENYNLNGTQVYRPRACPSGRGFIMLFKPGQRIGHQVAYADGMIYDSALKEPYDWETWRITYVGWHIRNIIAV
jgi:hypothetical protein